VDAEGDVNPDPNVKSMLAYNAGSLSYHSEKGLVFNDVDDFTLDRSQIGNTGLIIEIDKLKFDFRTDRNIPEATADGRPDSFKGIYADKIGITLPKKWFTNVDNSTLQVAGYNMLIGTGGVSGTVALETLVSGGNGYMPVNIGRWEVGFNYFDITFKQNTIIESHISGQLTIPRFTNSEGQNAEIEISAHLNEQGDFNLTASEPQGIPLNLFNFVTINFLSLELGKENDTFYIGTSCEIWFENAIMKRVLGDQKIVIPRLRVYDNGSIEIVGGNSFIPTNITLDLGPIEIAVTGIHFGAHQEENDQGVMRKYNYWGFDGAISLDPLRIDARGEGIKYYYTVDNDEHGDDGDNFLRIQTIEVDLVIPSTASPESAIAIIHGMLTIPEPGVSKEYIGEVGIKLPKANLSGYAKMRLMPKERAFLIEAGFELPKPIPLAATGLSFYEFGGLLGFKYVAEKEAIGLVSGEDTWYDYYKHPKLGVNLDKFSKPPKTDEYSTPFTIGAGAVIATSHDDGNLFSTRLMLVLSLPSVFILDGRANVLDDRLDMMGSTEPPFFAGVAIGDRSVEFWFGADYKLPKNNGQIIELYAEVQAGFFKSRPRDWYLNFGTKDNPITAKVLTIVTAQSYLTLSATGIEAGARIDFDLNKRFGPAKVHIYAYFEMGGFISFERPQIGAYIALGGMIDIDIWIVGLTLELNAIFSVEAAKPFLIYAEIDLNVCVKFLWVRVCKSFTVQIKWEYEKDIDRIPIPALPYESGEYSVNRTKELVQAVNMVTNDSFEINFLGVDSGIPSPSDITKIIPSDSYVDIKTVKGLIPNAVSQIIGGHTGGSANYTDLIPPQRVVRGGREIRQVKHKYSIEEIEIKAWNGGDWIDYHPFEAVVKHEDREKVNNLRIGYWQRSGNQYDAIRLLATNPFSYSEAGAPGWMIPEQYGVTPSELFCESEIKDFECSNVLDKALGTVYSNPIAFKAHYINGAYFNLEHSNQIILSNNLDGSQTVLLLSQDNFRVTDEPNNFSSEFNKSLEFDNGNSLVIILPEPSVEVKLKLSTYSEGVTIRYYKSKGIENYNTVYEWIDEEYKTAEELKQQVEYTHESHSISKIVIEPKTVNIELINSLEQQIVDLYNNSYQNAEGDVENDPENEALLMDLLEQLEHEKSNTCHIKDQCTDTSLSFNVLYNKEKTYWRDNVIHDTPVQEGRELARDMTSRRDPYSFKPQEVLINDRTTLNDLYEYYQLGLIPRLDLTKKSVIFISFDASYESRQGSDSRELKQICDIGGQLTVNIYNSRAPEGPPPEHHGLFAWFIIIEIDKTNSQLKVNNFGKSYYTLGNVNSIPTLSDPKERFCDMHSTLKKTFTRCISSKETSIRDCFKAFTNSIERYDAAFSDIDLISLLQPAYGDLISYLSSRRPLLSVALSYTDAILDTLKELGACCCESTNNDIQTCTTSLQQVCWLSLENHEYNLTIPTQEAVDLEHKEMVDAVKKTVQPIWRPNTKYYVRFRLKDEVNNGEDNGEHNGQYDYYYGFKTVGPVGHYHKHNEVDYVPADANPDQYPLTSLRQYIDYNRSYPNADGNLLQAKPLFYGHNQCEITIYFSKPFAYHMLNDWSEYKGLKELKGTMHIAIKDPVTDTVIPYPLPEDFNKETVPVGQKVTWIEFNSAEEIEIPSTINLSDTNGKTIGEYTTLKSDYLDLSSTYHLTIDDDGVLSDNPDLIEGNVTWEDPNNPTNTIEYELLAIGNENASWNSDNDPRIPVNLQALNNMVDYINENNNAIKCKLKIGESIVPNSYAYSATLTNLKPRKLYTALVYNAFGEINSNSQENVASEQIHQFVFQTSRYQNFEAQVKSYWLRELDTDGTVLNERQAIFEIPLSLSTAEINTAYNIVAGVSDVNSDALELQYYHLFDRVTEGILGFNPVDPTENTEFNILKNNNTNKVVGVLIRNPEPFNIPKIPLETIEDTIAVVFASSGNVNNAYKVLYSKDYSQALIMHSSKEITDDALNFRFQYKTWNGSSYEVSDTVVINDIIITL